MIFLSTDLRGALGWRGVLLNPLPNLFSGLRLIDFVIITPKEEHLQVRRLP
jgi:hypothetical protein